MLCFDSDFAVRPEMDSLMGSVQIQEDSVVVAGRMGCFQLTGWIMVVVVDRKDSMWQT